MLEGVDALTALTNVMTIGEPLTVEGMRAVAKLERLQRFRAHNVPWIERGALDELANAPRLDYLQIYTLPTCVVGDPELAALCRIESLERLAMTAPQATDAGFANLTKLSNLREVHVIAPNVTEAGARTLAQMKTLERISLPGSWTDATLDSLRALPRLEHVYLPAGVSREAAQRFANDHPDCEVIRSEPGFSSERYSAEAAPDGEKADGRGD